MHASPGSPGAKGNGGGFAVLGSPLTLDGGSIRFNVAGAGGAIFHDAGSPVTIKGTKIEFNSAPQCAPPTAGCPTP